MVRVFALLEGHPDLVSNVRILHGVEEGSPEISRATAEGLSFVKNVIEPKLSTVQADIRALFRVTELIAKKVGITEGEIEQAEAPKRASTFHPVRVHRRDLRPLHPDSIGRDPDTSDRV